jgi:homoserine O-succinyltransferase
VVIGLLNNMSDGALRATEEQFCSLLREATPPGVDLKLRYFSLNELERGDAARAHMVGRYQDADGLLKTRLDGLIVTGAEPRAEKLVAESYWPDLARVIDWSEAERLPTVWSCLAAHAAVERLSGVSRNRLPAKHSGVFALQLANNHSLLKGAPRQPVAPHSRLNDLTAGEIENAGYEILACSPDVGVDTFVRRGPALSIFFQGHPEYDAGALAREYLRDVSRFLRRQQAHLPAAPAGYFDRGTLQSLQGLSAHAMSTRSRDLLREYMHVVQNFTPRATWRPWALHVYREWLHFMNEPNAAAAARTEAKPLPIG